MSRITEEKVFEHEGIHFRIEFRLMDDKYICHTVYRNSRKIFFKYINDNELKFYYESLAMYKDYLQQKGYVIYG